MYINKVVFLGWDDVEELDRLYGDNLISRTDYGTTEILSDTIQNIKNDIKNELETEYDFTYEEFKDTVSKHIGTDLYDMLEKGEVDFCLVV